MIAGSASTVPQAQDADNIFAPGEWGPTVSDERHRLVVFGVVDLPFGLQVSPIFQAATARPYTLLAGLPLKAGRQINARHVGFPDPARSVRALSTRRAHIRPPWPRDAGLLR